MEPVRTKWCVVLAMVFAMAGCIMLGCGTRGDEKRAEVARAAEAEKQAVKPVAAFPWAAEAKKPVEKPVAASPRAAEAKKPVEKPAKESEAKPDMAAKSDNKLKADAAAPQLEGSEPVEDDDFDRPETPEETARRLGPPLVEHPDKLQRLDAVHSIWLDRPGGRLVMVGEVCQRSAPLEMFVCLWYTKEHEAVLTARVPAHAAHAGLLALGAKVGHAVQFMPKYVPAAGTEIDIEVIWKDKDGKVQKRSGQDWVRDYQTKKSLELPWVFAGSGFWTDEQTGKKHYQAESGDFICVSNFSTAMLDLPIESSPQNEALVFEAFTERIPPLGTPVTIVLKPRLGKGGK